MLKWKSKLVLAALEATYGTDAAPLSADAVQLKDVALTPMDGTDIARDLEKPFLGGNPTTPGELHSKLAFKVEFAGSGAAGTAPNWGTLLRGCGVAETIEVGQSVTYNPVTDGHESLSIYIWIDTTRYVLKGTRGTCKITLAAQAIPYLEFEFTGLFTIPTEAAQVQANYAGYQDPLVANSTNTPVFTIGGTSFVMRDFALDLANAVENRFLIGSEGVLITDRMDMIETTVEAKKLDVFDPFTLAVNQARVPVVLTHGTAAGNTLTLQTPQAQIQRLQSLQNTQNIKEWPLRFSVLPDTGNDQWSLTLT